MLLVKKCPECGKLIRFPVDKGRIKVSCPCGFSFVADPDDRTIYKDAFFDRESIREDTVSDKIKAWLNSRKSGDIKKDTINSLLEFKYWIQNFHLLPTAEKIKYLIPAAIIFFSIIALILIF